MKGTYNEIPEEELTNKIFGNSSTRPRNHVTFLDFSNGVNIQLNDYMIVPSVLKALVEEYPSGYISTNEKGIYFDTLERIKDYSDYETN